MTVPGAITYHGDASQLVGRVLGTTMRGSTVVVTEAIYDRASNTTRATCRIVRDDEQVRYDAFGQAWIDGAA